MKKTRWINFLGGINLLFTLVVFILLGILFLIYNQLEFIFEPLVVIVSSIIMPFIIALLFYYLLSPIIDFLEKRKIRRLWGVLLLYFIVVAALAVLAGTLFPVLREQLEGFIENFPALLDNFIETVTGWIDLLPFGAEVDEIIAEGQAFLVELPQNYEEYMGGDGLGGIGSVVSGVTSVVVTIATFPIILFFMLKDEKKFFNAVLRVVPPTWREDLVRVSTQINNQVGAYVKGQLIIATSIAVMMFIGFTIIGLDYGGILAVAAGFLSIVPYLGPTLSFFPPLIIALLDSWVMVVQLLVVWFVIQFIDGNLIEPNVMGRQLHVHPLTIIVVLLVMGDLMGIFGLIFGVPIYAILKVLVVHTFKKFKKRYNKYYGDISGEYDVQPIEIAMSDEGRKPDETMQENVAEAKRHRKEANEELEKQSEEREEEEDKNLKDRVKDKIKKNDSNK